MITFDKNQDRRPNLYLASAKYYDEGNRRTINFKDLGFYKSYAKRDVRILELGCGTGRIAIELARMQCLVDGLDLSQPMLDIFQEKLEKESDAVRNRVDLHYGDMCDFDLPHKYRLIILPFRTFQSLVNDEQRETCLQLIHQHLEDGGTAIIDMFNPYKDKLDNFNTMKKLDYDYFTDNVTTRIKRYTIGEGHFPDEQIVKFHYKFIIKKKDVIEDEIIEPFEIGYIYENQMRKLLEDSGFKIDRMHTWWNFQTTQVKSKKELIFVVSKS